MAHLLCLVVLLWLSVHQGTNIVGAQDTLPAPPGLDAALKKSLETGEHLGQALKGVQDRVIRKPATAELLLDVIGDMSLEDALKKSEEVSQLDVIIALFQNAFDAKSIELLKTRGLPYLYGWSDELKSVVDDESSDEFLYMMQLFAGYRTLEGAQRVMSAAEAEILSDHPLGRVALIRRVWRCAASW